jgi:poly-beta-1,6-N-acetyl-D-glucosamine synthase
LPSIALSIGICAYNEEKNIGQLLDFILSEQANSEGLEVLVVCSGCTDKTAEVALKYEKKDSRVRVYIENERRGKASAVNHILLKAKGELILFISADTLPTKGCFARLIPKLRDPNVGVVCGNPVPINSGDSMMGRLVQLLWSFHDHVFKQLNNEGLVRHATEIFCMRRGIVENIPRETVNDDAYIALTVKRKGWSIKYEETSRVLICGPKTFREYFQQRRRILSGHYQVRMLTGEAPQYLIHLLPSHPARVLKIASWLTKFDPFTLLVFLSVELLINVIAISDSILGTFDFTWDSLESTKRITS